MAFPTGDGNWTVGITNLSDYVSLEDAYVEIESGPYNTEDGIYYLAIPENDTQGYMGIITFEKWYEDTELDTWQSFFVDGYMIGGAQPSWRFFLVYGPTGEIMGEAYLP